jgi:hypothetical protein
MTEHQHATLTQIAAISLSLLGKGGHRLVRQKKAADYLIHKGYEPKNVWERVRALVAGP